jgi:alkaline phosphatase
MKRRQFFTQGALYTAASSLLLPYTGYGSDQAIHGRGRGHKARNIIFLVSDGMSSGTLNMGNILLERKYGRTSTWLDLYRNNRVTRALMDMASANSAITDSAAASSSWGGGKRVFNGRLNYSEKGEEHLPIWQKFKAAGKKVGCVTTVPITHATPAGFCVSSKSRNDQGEIAEKYLKLRFDVMMGGGSKYFENRKDNRDLFAEYRTAGYHVARNKAEMHLADNSKPIMAVYDKDGLPHEIDRIHIPGETDRVPSLAEMTDKAIKLMSGHRKGFCLQVEAGKVDWAAHANDSAGLLYDQIAFEEAIKVAIDYAETDGNTLVIITTDHGNANPGLYYGKESDRQFETLHHYTRSNDWVLMGITKADTASSIRDRVKEAQGYVLTHTEADLIYQKFAEQKNDGVYNPYNLPFKEYADIQRTHNAVGYGSMEHSADYTELAMFGPGSEKLRSFMHNTELHDFMLTAAEVENKFG